MLYLHHILLHFPIAFGMTSFLFAALSLLGPAGRWREQASVMLVLGGLTAVAACFSGFLAADELFKQGFPEQKIALHRLTAVIATTAFCIAAVWAFLQLNLTAGARRPFGEGTGSGSGPFSGPDGSTLLPSATAAQATSRGMLTATVVVATLVGFAGHNGGDMVHPNVSPLHIAQDLASYLETRHRAIALWTGGSRPLLWPWHATLAGAGGLCYLSAMFVARSKKPPRSWLKIHKQMNFAAIGAMTGGAALGSFMVGMQADFHFRVFHSFAGVVTLCLAGLTVAIGHEIFRTMTAKEDRPALRAIHRWAGRTVIALSLLSIFSGLLRTTLLGM